MSKCCTLLHSLWAGWFWNTGFIEKCNLSWKDEWGIEEQGSNPFISNMEITFPTHTFLPPSIQLFNKNQAVQNYFLTCRKTEAVQKSSTTSCAVTCSSRAPKLCLRRSLKLRKFFQNGANWFCQNLKRHFPSIFLKNNILAILYLDFMVWKCFEK